MKWRRLVGLTTGLGAVLALVSVLMAGARPTRLCRYVSDPLPDGYRYTFLYPDRLQVEHSAYSAQVYLVSLRRGVTPWSLTHGMPSLGVVGPGSSQYESITVTTYPARKTRNWGWRRDGSPGFYTSTFILQSRYSDARTEYVLSYDWHASQDRWCRPLSSQVVDSFRILAPGEAPPVDAAPRAATTSKGPNGAGNDLAGR